MSLLHPLAEHVPLWTNHHDHANIDFSDPQPVLLNGNIYMKGKCDERGQFNLWKYSISSHTFSPIPCPPSCGNEEIHLLTVHKSSLLLLNATHTSPDPRPEFDPEEDEYGTTYTFSDNDSDAARQTKSKFSLYSYKLQKDTGWKLAEAKHEFEYGDPMYGEEDIDDELSCDHHTRAPERWDLLAASSNDNLLVAFFRQDSYCCGCEEIDKEYYEAPIVTGELMIFNEHLQYTNRVTMPRIYLHGEESKIIKPAMFTFNSNLYFKVWKKFESVKAKSENFQKVCIKSLTTELNTFCQWSKSHSIPDTHSNVAFLNDQPIVGVASKESSGEENSNLYLCALTKSPAGDAWVEIASFDAQFSSAPIVIGSPDANKLVVIGMRTDSNQRPDGELQVLEVTPQVLAYTPESRFSLSAINRIQVGANISLLTILEESPETLSNLQELARFDLSKGITPFYCKKSHQIPKYISGWLECSSSSDLRPTWNNLIAILKKMTPTCRSVANEIEKYLLSFMEADTDNQKLPTNTNSTSSEEISFLKDKLDSLYQELDRDHENGGTTSISISLVKEKVKACLGQSDVALHKLRAEKQDLLDRVSAVTKENEEIRKELQLQDTKNALSKVAHKDTTSDSDDAPPAKRARSSGGEPETSTSVKLTDKHLPILFQQLKKHAARWREIGLHLGFLPGELDNIEAKPNLIQGAPLSYLGAMLTAWTQWAPGDGRGSADFAKLEDLKTALSDAELGATAHELYI